MNLLQLSWKNLTFRPLAMMLSVLLFALGVGLISILFLVKDQLNKNFESNLAGIDLVVGAKGSPLQLILSSMYHIDNPTGNVSLQEVRPFLNPKHPLIQRAVPLSLGDSYRKYRIVGTTPAILDLYGTQLASGQVWQQDFDVVAGGQVAQELGLKLGDTFSSSHGLLEDDNLKHEHTAFHIAGILQPNGTVLDQLLLTSNQTYWQVHAPAAETTAAPEHEHHEGETASEHEHEPRPAVSLLDAPGDQQITSLLIQFKGRNFQALNMQRSINENTNLQAATPAIEITRLYTLLDPAEKALRLLAILIIFVSGLSIFVSLYASLQERQYELALLRVMGARPRTLFLLIIGEGLLLAVIGFGLGMLLSHVGMQMLAGTLHEAYRYTFTGWHFLPEEGYLFLGALGIGLLAAILPAIKASRTDISETLLKD
ncbi:MAG: hypothetical protein DA408_01135 [Bacteroidetes bacterium]|nr:MAG: hypothetical protein C7N36_00780 [Bacteroidota bacterium]PTM14926.1 MAG: hypothetical protein DA408_01135 [Bacteroidota bacterium]